MRERFRSTLEFAYGFMGLSVQELAGYTLFEFDLKCEGFTRRMNVEESHLRSVAWFAMAPHLDQKDRSKGMTYFWPMQSDKEAKSTLFTKDQIEANIQAYKAFKQRMLNRAVQMN